MLLPQMSKDLLLREYSLLGIIEEDTHPSSLPRVAAAPERFRRQGKSAVDTLGEIGEHHIPVEERVLAAAAAQTGYTGPQGKGANSG